MHVMSSTIVVYAVAISTIKALQVKVLQFKLDTIGLHASGLHTIGSYARLAGLAPYNCTGEWLYDPLLCRSTIQHWPGPTTFVVLVCSCSVPVDQAQHFLCSSTYYNIATAPFGLCSRDRKWMLTSTMPTDEVGPESVCCQSVYPHLALQKILLKLFR